jgi:hypothetical protein
MLKPKQYEIYVKFEGQAIVKVTAESFEDAFSQIRKIGCADVIKTPSGVVLNDVAIDIDGVMRS